MHFIEIVIRDDKTILHKEVAQVPDDFPAELLESYRVYYSDAKGDTALYQRIARGLIEGVMNNVAAAKSNAQPGLVTPQEFHLESELPPPEETGNVGSSVATAADDR